MGGKVEFYKSKLYSPWAQIMKAVGSPTGEQLKSRQGLVVEITVCDCGLLAGLDGGARQQCSSPKAGSPRPDGHQPSPSLTTAADTPPIRVVIVPRALPQPLTLTIAFLPMSNPSQYPPSPLHRFLGIAAAIHLPYVRSPTALGQHFRDGRPHVLHRHEAPDPKTMAAETLVMNPPKPTCLLEPRREDSRTHLS